MTIDDSGKWWKGSEPTDLAEYLRLLSAESYIVHVFKLSQCSCGSEEFRLKWLSEGDAAHRECTKCGHAHYICDSEENWEGKSRKYKCVGCRSSSANVGVGFSLYAGASEVRWLFVGARCSVCGTLGCVADWKVGYEPSSQLLQQA